MGVIISRIEGILGLAGGARQIGTSGDNGVMGCEDRTVTYMADEVNRSQLVDRGTLSSTHLSRLAPKIEMSNPVQ